ncbi:host cell division inhibitor Icd-like protein [Escherichia coli]|nr:host cell division inhibitor Icd-like protein [Escherichia coli]
MNITKSAPLPERPCEQLTCCEKNGSVQGNYINRVTKRHNCRITGKEKATCHGGPSTQIARYPQRMSIANNATFAAGGQCDQPGGRLRPALIFLGVVFMKSSRANLFGVSLLSRESSSSILRFSSDVRACSRVYSRLDSSSTSRSLVRSIIDAIPFFFWFRSDLSIVHSCKAMRRSTSHHGADGCYPLGSMPRRFSSVRPNSLSQLARLMPSLCASLSNCSFSSGEIRILNCGDCPSPLGLLSRLIVDKWSPIELAFLLLGDHLNTETLKKAKPEGARNTNGLLTTNDNESIEVAMRNHTTHSQGRDSHDLNKYIWRFIALSTAQPRVITIEATSEQEARQQSPTGCVMVFAARIRQGVHHVQ